MKKFGCMLIWLALLIGLPALAQADAFGLSVEDYDLLITANTTELSSFAFDFTTQFAVEGLDTFAINADLSGSGAVDREAHAFSAALKGDLVLGSGQQSVVNTQVSWIEDSTYLNLGDGWQLREDAYQWAAELIYQIVTLDADPAVLAQWDLSGIDGYEPTLAALRAIDPSAFVGIERLEDEAVGDVQTAHFQITIDPYALMQTEAFVDVVATLANAQGTPLVIEDHDSLTVIVQTNSALFEGSTITVDQYIGLNDKLIHRLSLNLDFPLDPTRLGFSDSAFTATATFDIAMSGHNQPVDIAVPEDAEIVTAFTVPEPAALEPPGEGITQYVFFETVAEGETFTQAFEAAEGDTVTVTVRGLGLDYDSIATLLSPTGETLAESDDYETSAFGLSGFDPQIADAPIPESGTYTINVQEYDGAAGSFALTITVRR